MSEHPDFESLTPEVYIEAVENGLGCRLTGMARPLTSYINRVYELQDEAGDYLVAKFYRPGRWSAEALQDEHDFVLACAQDEIPVVAPLELSHGSSLGCIDGIYFAVYPRRAGRELDIRTDDDWRRLGSVMGRIHLAGSRKTAEHRITLDPIDSTREDIDHLLDGGYVGPARENAFSDLCEEIMESISDMFEDSPCQRIHGDSHRGNLLDRPGEGILVIDFDDMVNGPPVQDLWMLLPDHAHRAKRELTLILEGYEQFMEFDDYSLRLIEPLRIMRILYFLAWCSRQVDDYRFQTNFPDWGSDAFWLREISDLRKQLDVIQTPSGQNGNI